MSGPSISRQGALDGVESQRLAKPRLGAFRFVGAAGFGEERLRPGMDDIGAGEVGAVLPRQTQRQLETALAGIGVVEANQNVA